MGGIFPATFRVINEKPLNYNARAYLYASVDTPNPVNACLPNRSNLRKLHASWLMDRMVRGRERRNLMFLERFL
ncbi:MAG: hypothetical protein AMJ53_08810 [Gammaproteobacteria bacterium SG8_11]|nr:MAG: hypothetical protein AMJ53_08810 [Gammaproteobacteria bacterium SG8_11]